MRAFSWTYPDPPELYRVAVRIGGTAHGRSLSGWRWFAKTVEQHRMTSDGGGFHSNRWPQSGAELAKIRLVLEPDAPYETETIWARAIGDGLFVLDNVPFFAYGLSLGDKVYAHPTSDSILEYSGIAERGGHSTYRVALSDSVAATRAEGYWQELQSLGCDREIATSRLWAFDLAPAVDIHSVYRILETAEAAGTWTFEEVHVGHELG